MLYKSRDFVPGYSRSARYCLPDKTVCYLYALSTLMSIICYWWLLLSVPLGFGWKPIPSAARVTRDEVSGIRKVRESCLEDSTTLMCSLAFASLATCNKQIQLHQYFVKLLHQFNFLWLQFVCFDFLWTALLCSSEQELQLFHINSHISDSFLLKNKRLFSNFSTKAHNWVQEVYFLRKFYLKS